MRYAVIHCRKCSQHIWVPVSRLGALGRCPECDSLLQTPAQVPTEELVEGPHIMHDFRVTEEEMAAARA